MKNLEISYFIHGFGVQKPVQCLRAAYDGEYASINIYVASRRHNQASTFVVLVVSVLADVVHLRRGGDYA